MGEHALLSASSSHRWLHCTPSARLEEEFENTSSVFAAEGTAAHELSEYKLRQYLGETVKRPVSEFDSDDLDYYTDIYVDYAIELITEIRSNCKDPIILLEQRLDYSCYVDGGFGTGDLVIVADSTLDIVDLKYGKGVAVSAEENPQMKLYALGALALFDSLYDIKTVRMTICQPRLESISTYEITADKLIAWAEGELRPRAKLAINGEGEFLPGGHCRFCRARHTCRARADEYLSLAKYDFKLPALLSEEEISEVLNLADRIATWAADVYAFATDLAIREGKEWHGYKLVEGRSNRRYTNERAVVETVTAAGYTDIYKQSLIGITDMEKLLGKKMFKELLSGLVEKPAGKPTLVQFSDKRQAISLNNTAEADFKEVI
ncbi:DUF2800 domain-containing protein [Desulfosporosinus sp.]|uniref:DUF2800 domain-containing protein n=1 Tax=Desulfosporosinus sp. TaxID=157907 RepID=UPI0025BB6769|nr:DUF2800 domain-containing protein [Desulfosporosinus sp.]MBC2723231.1 DUF2800 domain-containing protein [Desulfosporosinus sp.]MBC2727106.1 DUF2800 domain-containing protein [Desulfosporosinus sp.]